MSKTLQAKNTAQASNSRTAEEGESAAPPSPSRSEISTRAKQRATISKFLVALVLFGASNAVLLNVAALRPKPLDRRFFSEEYDKAVVCGMPGAWWVARGYVNQDRAPDVVIFGSSQMGGLQAADAQTLNQNIDFVEYHRAATVEKLLREKCDRSVKTYTLALPGAMASDHYIMSRALFTAQLKPKCVIVGLSPRDFMDNFLPSPGATEQFKFFSKYVELGSLAEVAFPDPLGRIDWFMTEKLPLRRLVKAFSPEPSTPTATEKNTSSAIKKDKLLSAIYTSSGNIKPGQCIITPTMPEYFVDNTYEYKRRYRKTNPPTYGEEMTFFRSFLESMKKERIKVIVLGMPLVASNRAQLPASFWKKFRSDIGSLCSRYGARWTDYAESANFAVNDFVDTVHLNARGGQKLAQIMADQVACDPELVDSFATDSKPVK